MSNTIAEALQRAREAARKIEEGRKRPLEEEEQHGEDENFPDDSENKRARTEQPSQSSNIDASNVNLQPNQMNIASDRNLNTIEHRVPNTMVGLIIGRGGEQINRIQDETGCRVKMAPESYGESERICTISGTPEAIEQCKNLIDEIVNSKMTEINNGTAPGAGGDGGGGTTTTMIERPPNRNPENQSSGPVANISIEMILPPGRAGLLIGKGGENIKSLQAQAGVKMVIIQEDNTNNPLLSKPLKITGPPANCEHAKQLVQEFLNNNAGGATNGAFGGHEVSYTIHSSKCGILIGKGGDTVKNIIRQTGARIEIKKIAPPDDPDAKTFFIRGTPEQIEYVKEFFIEKIGELPPPNNPPVYEQSQAQTYQQQYQMQWNMPYQQWPNPQMMPQQQMYQAPQHTMAPMHQQQMAPSQQPMGTISQQSTMAPTAPQQMVANPRMPMAPQQTQNSQQPSQGIPNAAPTSSMPYWNSYYPQMYGQAAINPYYNQQPQQPMSAMPVPAPNMATPSANVPTPSPNVPSPAVSAPIPGQNMPQSANANVPNAPGSNIASAIQQHQASAAAPQQDYTAAWIQYYRSTGQIKEAEALENAQRQKQQQQQAALHQQNKQTIQPQPQQPIASQQHQYNVPQPQHPSQQPRPTQPTPQMQQPAQNPGLPQQQTPMAPAAPTQTNPTQQAMGGTPAAGNQDYAAWAQYYRANGYIKEAEQLEKWLKQTQQHIPQAPQMATPQ